MPTVIAIGASAGGPRALWDLFERLPADFPAAFLVVIHMSPNAKSLAETLSRRTRLRVTNATQGAPLTEGTVYVCVPDHHLMLVDGHVRLTRGPRENHARPAVDVLFRSCALALGSQAIGVVLTGALDDGTAGLWTIKDVRGQAIAQLPEEAEFPSMPQSAIQHVAVDHVARVADMPALLAAAVTESRRRGKDAPVPDKLKAETQIAQGMDALKSGSAELGPATQFTCPDCGGVLAQIDEGSIVRFRCHTGHAYSAQTLLDQTNDRIEGLLWKALRAFDERTLILERHAASATGHATTLQGLHCSVEDNRRRGEALRQLLVKEGPADPGT